MNDDFVLSQEHLAAVKRRRRIFFHYDDGQIYQSPTLLGGDMKCLIGHTFGYIDMPGSQIDTLCLDINGEGQASYPSKILPPRQHPGLQKWRDQGIDYIEPIVAACRERGREMFWSHRVNEVERDKAVDSEGITVAAMNPAKKAHPDRLTRSWWWQGFWNLATEGARSYKLGILSELAERYELDGFQLDFARHGPHLPPGRQWELRDGITDFVAAVRKMTLKREAERGRPFLLAVRIPENLEGCRIDGIDAPRWIADKLVDILVLGTRTMRVDVQAFRSLVGDKPIKIIPSFDGFHTTEGYCLQPIEYLRGVYSNFWHQGADAVGTFNWAPTAPQEAMANGINPDFAFGRVYPKESSNDASIGEDGDVGIGTRMKHQGIESRGPANKEIGSVDTLLGKTRFFAVERRGGYPFCEGYFGRNDGAPLPAILRNHGAIYELPIHLWENTGPDTSICLRLTLFDYLSEDRIRVDWNHVELKQTLYDLEWKDPQIFSPLPQPISTGQAFHDSLAGQRLVRLEFDLPAGLVRRGENVVGIRVTKRGVYKPCQDVKIEKVEVHMK